MYSKILLCLGSLFFCSLSVAEKKNVFDLINSVSPNRPRIINGDIAVPHEFPFVAMITDHSGWQYCGGALIDPEWVLTAAHCIHETPAEYIYVRLGGHHKGYSNDQVDRVHRVDEVIEHKNFVSWNLTNDIALLHLSVPAEIRQEVRQGCLYHTDHSFHEQPLKAMGWGTIDLNAGVVSDVLRKLDKKGLGRRACEDALIPHRYEHALYDGSLCAIAEPGKDVCFGDSGSPLVWRDWYDDWRIVGLTSWGFCGTLDQVPAVYTRVSHFLDWILTNAPGIQIC